MKFISPVSVLEVILHNKEWLEWEPETVWRAMDDMYPSMPQGKPTFPRILKDIIGAIKLCLANNMAFEQWNVFSNVALSFNNEIISFDIFQKPTIAQVSYAVYVMSKIRAEIFGEEVCKFIACIAKDDGYVVLPDNLSFCQPDLDLMNMHIKEKVLEVKEGWMKAKIDGNIPGLTTGTVGSGTSDVYTMINDSDLVTVQVTKLLAVKKYVSSKVATHQEGGVIKLGSASEYLRSIIEPFQEIGASLAHGYRGYTMSLDQADEIAKYINMNNRSLITKSARDGILFMSHDINYTTMDESSIVESIESLTSKTIDELGKIHKALYRAVERNRSIISPASRAVGTIGSTIGDIGQRFNNFIGKNILRKGK